MSNQSVIITGAAGFIGSNLSEYYLKNGFKVVGIDNFLTGSPGNIDSLIKIYPENFYFTKHDAVKDWDFKIDPAFLNNVKYIFHLASPASVLNYQKHAINTLWVNSIGLNNALNFANNLSARLIFSSTSEVYGMPIKSPQHENDWGHVNSFGPRSCYDESKRFGEALIYSMNANSKIKHGIVRIFNTYGPKMSSSDDRVINTFLKSAVSNQDITVFGNGEQTRSFCYIDDLIRGLTLYADSSLDFPINLGNSNEISINELAKKIISLTNSKSALIYRELPQDDPLQRKPDLSFAKKYLNYQPEISLDEGIKKLIGTR